MDSSKLWGRLLICPNSAGWQPAPLLVDTFRNKNYLPFTRRGMVNE